MVDVGFSAQKLYGSVWHLSPTPSLRLDRSIQFHEPHGGDTDGKIGPRQARRMGSRMNRAFGWDGDMFVSE